MKDWIVCPMAGGNFWLTRIEMLPDGKRDYLCGCCDGPLEDHVVGFFQSSRGEKGVVASSICWRCHLLLGDHELPAGELDATIELLLAEATSV